MDSATTAQPDHSGLQVIQYHPGAPEVVDSWTPPEVAREEDKYYYQNTSVSPYKPERNTQPKTYPAVLPWWRRKRWIALLGAAVALAVIAIVLGVVVGKRSSPSSPTNPITHPTTPSNATDPPSACRGTICTQILSAAILKDQLMLFARGIDNAIWYTSAPINGNNAPTYSPWSSLPADGPFLTQPSAISWPNNTQVAVLAASDPGRVVKLKAFTTPSSSTSWDSIGLFSQSPISTCLFLSTRPDFWSTLESTVAHNWLERSGPPNTFYAENRERWQINGDFGIRLQGRPGVVCREDGTHPHDLVVYGIDGAVRHSSWRGAEWTRAFNRGGKFKGDPTVVQVGNGRFDFFGIGDDEESGMWYFRWSTKGGFGSLERLGGGPGFESVPGVVVTGDVRGDTFEQVRVDVVALGRNGRLWHRVLKGGTWLEEWEDLGVFGNSAPLVVDLKDGRVGVYVIGVDGQVNQTVWSVSDETSWKGLVWNSIGGKMTTDFYRS
ncbi:hypothetical protein QBC44DRAFT_33820 [Cladorrhinum sp. PSN332]|nr:hypothetical protein QBC44DRAFT_33820 [Cladorrhinum sp. PSN332]